MTNKEIIQRYPFMRPLDLYTGEYIIEGKYTYFDAVEEGWHSLLFDFCEELRQLLIQEDLLDTFKITQIKNKFGRLTIYTERVDQPILEKIRTLIKKYGDLSERTCECCGALAPFLSIDGYIAPFCEKCAIKIISDYLEKDDTEVTEDELNTYFHKRKFLTNN